MALAEAPETFPWYWGLGFLLILLAYLRLFFRRERRLTTDFASTWTSGFGEWKLIFLSVALIALHFFIQGLVVGVIFGLAFVFVGMQLSIQSPSLLSYLSVPSGGEGALFELDPMASSVIQLAASVSAVLTLLLVTLTVRDASSSPVRALGMRTAPPPGVLGSLLLLWALLFIPFSVFAERWVKFLQKHEYSTDLQDAVRVFIDKVQEGDVSFIVVMVLGVVVFAPVVEEVLFRGLLYGSLRRRFGFVVSAIFSSIPFALVHVSLVALVPIFVLSLFLSAIYERRGNLYEAMFFHAIFNATNLVMATSPMFNPDL